MDEQAHVAAFLDAHDLRTDPAYRVLDLASEVGELAKEVNESTGYGTASDEVAVAEDELGLDAGTALETALGKYESRVETSGDPGSGA